MHGSLGEDGQDRPVGIRAPSAPAPASTPRSEGREAIIPVLDQFQRDIIRMVATLFGPMLAGAIIIPLLMMIFSYMGYEY
ncbi:MAG TPA: hypothetical protein VLA17_07980 [Candidatus Limnocylindria bacterium]|nr:hypothetical protein [Candidatus Limnocylindria bacterium]